MQIFILISILTIVFIYIDLDELKIELNSLKEKDYDHLFYIVHHKKDNYIRYKISILIFIIVLFYKNNIIYALILSIITYFLYYRYLKFKYHKLLLKTNQEFPYYLNNLVILIGQNPIVNALNKSIDYAPLIFKKDLEQLIYDIHNNNTIEPYLVFAKKFKEIDDINRIMRSLYNLQHQTSNSEILITSLSKIANEKLNISYDEDLKAKLEKQALIPYILFLWLGLITVQMITTLSFF